MTLATHEEVIEPEIVLSFAEHVEAVSGHHESFKFHRGKTVESAILTGQALSSAKADLPRGKWEKFLARVGMSRQYAHRFMQVGENLNVHNCGQLPKAVAALYELSRLDPSDIEEATTHPRVKIFPVDSAETLIGSWESITGRPRPAALTEHATRRTRNPGFMRRTPVWMTVDTHGTGCGRRE